MAYENGNAGPTGLKNAGFPGYSFTFNGVSTWVPDLNASVVQQDLGALIGALGQRYGNDPAIESVDAGFVGAWGEYHFTGATPRAPHAQPQHVQVDVRPVPGRFQQADPRVGRPLHGKPFGNSATR